MAVESDASRQQWQDAVIRAAAEASRLQPLAGILMIATAALILGAGVAEPLVEFVNSGGEYPPSEMARAAAENLVEIIPAIRLAIFAAPTLEDWVHGHFGFSFNLEARDLALAGLGLLLSLIARVVRNVVEVAAALKRENDQIV